MKEKILKKLHQILIDIVRADEPELDKIGEELVEIEKRIMMYGSKQKVSLIDKSKNL